MEPQIVIAMYRPNAGRAKDLEVLVARHGKTLRELEMVTDRKPVIARAKDGTIVEVFEWRSADAVKRAHHHPAVAAVWEAMGQCSTFATLGSLEEAAATFPHFAPMAL